MTEVSLAQKSATTTRELRGLALFEEHGSEIRFDAKLGVWLVPSQHASTSVYEVTLGRRGEFCECADFEYRGQSCKHVTAATIARAKSGPCAGCGQRFRHRDLYEVHEDHESLTWFSGDLLCERCALDTGIL